MNVRITALEVEMGHFNITSSESPLTHRWSGRVTLGASKEVANVDAVLPALLEEAREFVQALHTELSRLETEATKESSKVVAFPEKSETSDR